MRSDEPLAGVIQRRAAAKNHDTAVKNLDQNLAPELVEMSLAMLKGSISFIENLEGVTPNWQGLMKRELALGDFKILCHQLDAMIKESTNSALGLRSSLTDILMAQDFQDLTGQMIRRVIDLVQEIEAKLVTILTVCHSGDIESKSDKKENNIEKTIEAEGPALHAEKREDVVNGQDDVDDLLSSLGF